MINRLHRDATEHLLTGQARCAAVWSGAGIGKTTFRMHTLGLLAGETVYPTNRAALAALAPTETE